MRKAFVLSILILTMAGCAAQMREAGRQAAAGAFEIAQTELSKRLDAVVARVDSAADRAHLEIEAKTPDIVKSVRDAMAPQINAAIDAGAAKAQGALDAAVADLRAKQERGETLNWWQWLILNVLGTGMGTTGILTVRGAARKILGTTVPVDHAEIADAVAAKLATTAK